MGSLLENSQKVYFVGIKGSGMAALVEILKKMGKKVTGSDTTEKFFTDKVLKKIKVSFFEGFDVKNLQRVGKIDLIIYSTAYNIKNNPELEFAKKTGIPMLSYPEAIGLLMKNKIGIAVCGTHGKTTTTAMLALALREAGADPTAIVGSRINQIGSNALVGRSKYFIVEADEYQNKFLNYNPLVIVLTSLDFDHPDFFKDFSAYKKAFIEFIRKIPLHGFLIAWGGSNSILEVVQKANCEIILYDFFSNEKKLEIEKALGAKIGKIKFFGIPEDLKLKIPGRHNLLNAGAVLAVCQKLKINQERARKALENYQGTARRFEKLGEYQGAIIIDDYAHHPEEIKATLKAVKEKYPTKKIICVFHPHTFSRTEALLLEFSKSFDNCDELIVLDVYGSAREKEGKVGSTELVKEISKFKSNVFYLPKIEEAVSFLRKRLENGDLLLTMGAGNVNEIGQILLNQKDSEKIKDLRKRNRF